MTELTRALIEASLPAARGTAVPEPDVPEEVLRRSWRAALAERAGSDGLWVFAYGALTWERDFARDRALPGRVRGMASRYCLRDVRERGTPGRPGLTLGLEPARAAGPGIALHLPEDGLEAALWTVWRHEMPAGYYQPRWVEVSTADGPLDAVTFVADPASPSYVGALPDAEVARVLATAVGPGGPAASYLRQVVARLREAGVPDPALEALQARVAEHGGG